MNEIIDDLYEVLKCSPSHEAVQKLLNRIGYWEVRACKTETLNALRYLLLTEHLRARYASAKLEQAEFVREEGSCS